MCNRNVLKQCASLERGHSVLLAQDWLRKVTKHREYPHTYKGKERGRESRGGGKRYYSNVLNTQQ